MDIQGKGRKLCIISPEGFKDVSLMHILLEFNDRLEWEARADGRRDRVVIDDALYFLSWLMENQEGLQPELQARLPGFSDCISSIAESN